MKVIDVSSYQQIYDYHAVKADGVQGAVLRSVVKNGTPDTCFKQLCSSFQSIGLPVAAYVYSYDLSYNAASVRADQVKKLIEGKNMKFLALDLEWDMQRKQGKTVIAQVIQAYLDCFADTGVKVIGYWNLDWHKNVIPEEYKQKMKFWIARYPKADNGTKKESLKPNVGEVMWQYSSKGTVEGIKGAVDLNECYVDLFEVAAFPPEKHNPYPVPGETLYRYRAGMKKDSVKWLQQELNDMGYALVVDGMFGQATEAALKAAQAQMGIMVDGKCGSVTRTKLIAI